MEKARNITVTYSPCKHGTEPSAVTITGTNFAGEQVIEKAQIVCCDLCEEEINAISFLVEGIKGGHVAPDCVSLFEWRFCSGLDFRVRRAERAGISREEIAKIIMAAIEEADND